MVRCNASVRRPRCFAQARGLKGARIAIALVLIAAALAARAAFGSGILVPTDESVAPLRIVDHLVAVDLADRVALTTLNQTFENTTNRQLEATYIFPIPEGADLTDFRMTFNGKMVQGEVLPADEARSIYESIVRRNRDPGLIEFVGRRLLRARVFPIEPHSKTEIQLSYQQVTDQVSDMWRYQYPLRTPGENATAYGTVRFAVSLQSPAPLRAIWSPTHEVEIVREGDTEARAVFERQGASLADDFVLLYDAENRDVGLSLVSHRENEAEPGHFLLILSPKALWDDAVEVPQDYVFVVDTSGSMASDGKMEQAKQAVKYCVERLEERDRFSMVRFSTGFDALFDELKPVNAESKKAAAGAINKWKPSGGTNINDALKAAVKLRDAQAQGRPFVIVFITDGQGDQAREVVEATLAAETKDFREGVRLFPFGVGHDVNTKLLDALATGYGGAPTYVQPGENLEYALGDFFTVFSEPVLTDLRLSLPEAGITEKFPPEPGDLYHGRQLLLAGQFEKPATGPVKLTAKRGDQALEYVWEGVKIESDPSAGYVSRIWAGRKIAYLIDRIRLDGETPEKVEEVLALSVKYGIQTPYSSWLVAPESPRFATRMRDGDSGRVEGGAYYSVEGGAEARLRRVAESEGSGSGRGGADYDVNPGGLLPSDLLVEEAGADAVTIAALQASAREASSVGEANSASLPVRRIAGQTYVDVSGYLVDARFAEDMEAVEVKFASDAYFELVNKRADLRAALAANRFVVVMTGEKMAVIVRETTGVEKFDEALRARLGLK